ncbi:50S ribosomal protein L35 [Deinococcus proteolyticus MRP]|uniref:Large ribosomal subunit protein bL35 n=2 Tax=Deinococcus TaxID=1298 RepID=F0RP83_DEIPM|nr:MULTISPECIES: 50S ribosomal protein L35 [Deinococcus]ADY26426.1 50S ribosomal protein L35 [Deinococcus proteolyticus MRP]MCY1702545.1 50S ribosomal protein L35 [Deinococcus sp. SL84]GHG05032.1 50S ribosomal protein L35 [Deinococcus piscis]
MPKMKTKKSAVRRIKITATGKVMAFKSGKRHQNTGKSGNEIRGKGKGFVLAKSEWARMKAMKPYAGGK